ncbi:hypothetical protein [Paenibacillus popilliae]|uniref:hypothetical protein n=1 Tax=Paenibacillus popilliae TaxID=78057 RepID=UPI0002E8F8D5|nr:hypothetical protein [Paenibacillus popilliae]
MKNLELVTLAITENKPTGGTGIEAEAFLNQCGQTVDGFAQVGAAASQVDAGSRRVQHTDNARTTSVSHSRETPGVTSMVAGPTRITSAFAEGGVSG